VEERIYITIVLFVPFMHNMIAKDPQFERILMKIPMLQRPCLAIWLLLN